MEIKMKIMNSENDLQDLSVHHSNNHNNNYNN